MRSMPTKILRPPTNRWWGSGKCPRMGDMTIKIVIGEKFGGVNDVHMTFFDSAIDDRPIVIMDIMDRVLFVVPMNVWKRDGLDDLANFLRDAGLLEFGANAYQGPQLVGTTEY